MNLLKIKPFRLIISSKYFPIVPQIITFIAYIGLFIGSVGVGPHPRIASYLYVTNLANFLVWNLWLPVLILTTVFFGRIWCVVCPLELMNSLMSRIGFKNKPGILRSKWAITAYYAFILFVANKYLGLGMVPRSTAIYLAGIFTMAGVVGLIWEKRTFCSYVCPIGNLLGLYSHISFMEWRADNPAVCRECKTRDCAAKKYYDKLSGHSCTSNLYPARIPDNRDCLLCSHCMKACPDSNFRLSLRGPFADFFTKLKLKPAEMVLLLLVIGFVNNNWRSLVFIFVPLFLCLLVSWKSPRAMLNAFMVLLIPVTGAAHALHAFSGLIYNAPVWKFALSDPTGINVATMLTDNILTIDRSILAPAWRVHGITTGLLYGAIFAVSVLIIQKSPLTEKVGQAGKAALILSVASYIASFYIRIRL